MRFLFVIVFWLIIQPFASAAPNEIDRLVAGLTRDGGMWMNGIVQIIALPPDASPAKVVKQIAKFEGHGDQNNADQFLNYHILETKQVVIPDVPNNTFTAVLIASAKGSKTVILMSYETGGWWHRTFYITTVP